MAAARRLRTGMVSINGTLSFAGLPSLPFGGVGESGASASGGTPEA